MARVERGARLALGGRAARASQPGRRGGSEGGLAGRHLQRVAGSCDMSCDMPCCAAMRCAAPHLLGHPALEELGRVLQHLRHNLLALGNRLVGACGRAKQGRAGQGNRLAHATSNGLGQAAGNWGGEGGRLPGTEAAMAAGKQVGLPSRCLNELGSTSKMCIPGPSTPRSASSRSSYKAQHSAVARLLGSSAAAQHSAAQLAGTGLIVHCCVAP